MKKKLLDIYDGHHSLRKSSINLLPSENVLSPLSKKFLSSDMGQRYFFKVPFKGGNGISYSYSGTKYIEQIIDLGESIAKKLFSANYVSLYPVSGHQANLAVLFAFTKPGDSIIVFDSQHGGYPGLDKDKLPKYLGLKVHSIKTDSTNPELIDYPRTFKLIKDIKPKLVIYSSAHTLFPIDIKSLSSISHQVGAKFIYDGSHPLGLIAGGFFQKPLQEGADVLIAGTQKSFPGPQGGIIAANNYARELEKVNHFVIIDNPHFHRIAALAVSLAEMERFGNEYAVQVIKNTQILASILFNYGLAVKYKEHGFTDSHMFKIKLFDGFDVFIKNLERANIMIDSAGRIGTAEMTRYGMKENEMNIIAKFIKDIYFNVSPEYVKKEVVSLRENFSNTTFCFD